MGRTIAIGDIPGCNYGTATLVRSLKVKPMTPSSFWEMSSTGGPDFVAVCRHPVVSSDAVHFAPHHGESRGDDARCDGRGEWAAAWPRYGGVEILNSYGGRFDLIPMHIWTSSAAVSPNIETKPRSLRTRRFRVSIRWRFRTNTGCAGAGFRRAASRTIRANGLFVDIRRSTRAPARPARMGHARHVCLWRNRKR